MGNTISSTLESYLGFSLTTVPIVRYTSGRQSGIPLPIYTSHPESLGSVPPSVQYSGHNPAPRRSTFHHRSDPVALPPYPQPPWRIRGTIAFDGNQVPIVGGFNHVIQGYHGRFGRVALRRSIGTDHSGVSDDQSRLFAFIVDLWWGLRDPHILRLLGTHEIDDCVYTVSEWAAYGTLNQYLSKHPGAPRRPLLLEAAKGILYMHERGILYGDIKPTNLLVTADRHVQLCDFDLARPMSDATQPVLRGVGTLRYQAPELWDKTRRPKTAKSDVYAFGMTIYEVLSGNIPFYDCIVEGAVYRAVLMDGERPPQEPKFSPTNESYEPLWEIARDCWKSDPEQRPSMKEVVQRLGF